MEVFDLLEVSVWSGLAAVGFGILFNIPRKTIFTVLALGIMAAVIKFTLLGLGGSIVLASLVAATTIGFLSIRLAHVIHYPPVVFSIPPMIPMIPGFYAYQTLISVIEYTFLETEAHEERLHLLGVIFHNGFTMFFILIALILGVSLPMLLLRKTTVKK